MQKVSLLRQPLTSTIAASNLELPARFKNIIIVNSPTKDAYPIAGFTWALIYKEQNYSDRSAARAQKLLTIALVEYS